MKISDARIGMKVSVHGFPMTIVGIFTQDEGTLYLDFEGNEGDVWEEDVKDVEPIID